MSFGFGVGDFIAVGTLAWNLYHDCFLIARGAPNEFRLLVDELQTLHMRMKLFETEYNDPDSVLARAGEDRQRMVWSLLDQVRGIMSDLESTFIKHRNLGNISRSGLKRGWDKLKWSIDAKDVDDLRNKVRCQAPALSIFNTI